MSSTVLWMFCIFEKFGTYSYQYDETTIVFFANALAMTLHLGRPAFTGHGITLMHDYVTARPIVSYAKGWQNLVHLPLLIFSI